MYKRIIVAVGDYPEWDTAVAYAIALAADSDAELWLLRVLTVPPLCGAPDMVTCSHLALDSVMEAHAYVLGCAAAAAAEAGVAYTTTSLAQAQVPNGLSVTVPVNAGDLFDEEATVLVKESLAQLGIKLTLQKMPIGQKRSLLVKRQVDMAIYDF